MELEDPSLLELAPAEDDEADKNEGFDGAIGLADEAPEFLVAMAVGKTQDGESLPAKPSLV